MDKLTSFVTTALWTLTGIVVVVGTLVILITFRAHSRQRRLGAMDEEREEALRKSLMAYVREQTKGKEDKFIDLGIFCRLREITNAQLYVLLAPLLDDDDLLPRKAQDGFETAISAVRSILAFPVKSVKLNEAERTMWINRQTAIPPLHISNISGSNIQVGHHNTATINFAPSPQLIAALIPAMRSDALSMSLTDAERAESLADSLERDLAKDRQTSYGETFKTVLELVANGTSLWASCAALLAPWIP